MTQRREIAINTPVGHCRRCDRRLPLDSLALPSLVARGVIVVRGKCRECNQDVATFFSGTSLEVLRGRRLEPLYVALIVMGLRSGYRAGHGDYEARRADDMLRGQQRLRLTNRELAALFNLSLGRVVMGLADARRRAADSDALEQNLVKGRKAARTLEQLAAEYGLTRRQVADALSKASKRQADEDLDERMLRWRDKGWSYGRIGRKFGIERMVVKARLAEARRRKIQVWRS